MIENGQIKTKIVNLIVMNIEDLKKSKNGEINSSRNILLKKFYGGINFNILKMIINYSKKMMLLEEKI